MGFDSGEVKFLDRNPPAHDIEVVREVAQSCFGLHGKFRELDCERDQNFKVTAGDGRHRVLKIANVDETTDVIDMQVRAMEHIALVDPSLPVPCVIPCPRGQDFQFVTFPDGAKHIVYMLTYLDGVPLANMQDRLDTVTFRELGAFLGRLDQALQGFFHPAADQQHPWSVAACSRLQQWAKHVDRGRDEVEQVLDRMNSIVGPRLRTLRHQVVHQDAHAGNLLVDPGDPGTITGVIDFGDMLHGTLAAEIAVACESIPYATGNLLTPVGEITAGFDSVSPLEEDEIEVIFDLVAARNALAATVVATRAALTPEQPAHICTIDPFVDRLQELNDIGREAFNRHLRSACRFPVYCPVAVEQALPPEEESRLVEARHSLLGRNATHFYERPMHFERARGPWLFGTDGRRYLDCYNNVPQVGHCHPHVVNAIARQAGALNTNTRYLYSSVLEYAERLTGKLAPHLTACIFVNSGSEANDVAWQMAKLVTGHAGAIIMEDAYHGVTDAIRLFSPGHPGTSLPDFLQGLRVPDPYRGPFRDDDPEMLHHYTADADAAVAALESTGHGTAAFMIDSAFCSSGVPDVPDGYLRAVEASVRSAGGLMICDEVQSGFGRMGQWWGHEHHGVRADIVTMGKPVGNGHPLGVVVTTDEILNSFIDQTRLFSTFGGNTVACAAGNAVLDVIESEDLIARGRTIGNYMRDEIAGLATKHELIGDVRGHGMVTGLEFVSDRAARIPATTETARLLEVMRDNGVLVGSEGRDANVLKLRPSLVFCKEHVDVFIDALDRSLSTL